jgi:hypothetical protein
MSFLYFQNDGDTDRVLSWINDGGHELLIDHYANVLEGQSQCQLFLHLSGNAGSGRSRLPTLISMPLNGETVGIEIVLLGHWHNDQLKVHVHHR